MKKNAILLTAKLFNLPDLIDVNVYPGIDMSDIESYLRQILNIFPLTRTFIIFEIAEIAYVFSCFYITQ
jgi:hypothetical protein